jgi:hypothetical protein
MTFEVIDNFISDYHFKLLTNTLLGDKFPWYFNDHVVDRRDGRYQFTHGLQSTMGLSPYPDQEEFSDHYPLVLPILQKLKATRVFRVKANLNPKTFFHRRAQYHIDIDSPEMKTAIFYMNTCNGWTKFKKGGRVKSVANRVVTFHHKVEHAGVTCTDEPRRVVINLNYV